MTWNYRLVRHDDGSLIVYEVFYDESGEMMGRDSEPAKVILDDVNEFPEVLEMIAQAMHRPIIEESEFSNIAATFE